MGINRISNIEGFIHFVSENSTWSPVTLGNFVNALGYRKNGGLERLKQLSSCLVYCAKHGAACGIHGFTMYDETVRFFQQNRRDIARNLEAAAKNVGGDTAGMIRDFGVLSRTMPAASKGHTQGFKRYRENTRRFNGLVQCLFMVLSGGHLGHLVQIPRQQLPVLRLSDGVSGTINNCGAEPCGIVALHVLF